MASTKAYLDPPPAKGTAEGEFFEHEESPFAKLFSPQEPAIVEGDEEMETNDILFKALKQDVLLQMFEPGLQDDDTFPYSGNLFAIANQSCYFACGCQNGLLFGKTDLLRTAFEEAQPKSQASLKGAYNLPLPSTPTHVRFTSDEKSLIIAIPGQGILVLACNQLQKQKSLIESTISSINTPTLIDILPNPSPQHASQIAYITRAFTDSPYGDLVVYDIFTQRAHDLEPKSQCTCMTFSSDGQILLACTKSGEALYYNFSIDKAAPLYLLSPIELPKPEDEAWWSISVGLTSLIQVIQGVHWIDKHYQLVIYNPLTHPDDPPVHDYQAYIISNPHVSLPSATSNIELIKLPTPPVDAFGNIALRPWFWFQTLHNWKPGIQDLVICSVTAGSDVGLVGRCNTDDSSKPWRIWTVQDENRRATVPYDMERNEETIVAGMQLDFTSTKKLEKPLFPDENPSECEALPILWVLNTAGQLAGWTIIYAPGVKAGERSVSMMSTEWQAEYWREQWGTTTEEKTEKSDSVGSPSSPGKISTQPARLPQRTGEGVSQLPTKPMLQEQLQTPQTPLKPIPIKPSPVFAQPSQSILGSIDVTHPTFGRPSQLGASTFGQPGQVGGIIPGQTGTFPALGALGTSRTTHIFGQTGGLGAASNSSLGVTGGGFAKYQPSQGSGFLSGQPGQAGSFLQGNQPNSFLRSGQEDVFAKSTQDQGFAKYAGVAPSQSATTPMPSADGGFLGSKPASSITSPFGVMPRGPLSQRTQSLTSSIRSKSYDMFEDSSQETGSDESDVVESESDEDRSVRVEAVEIGEGKFDLNLDGKSQKQGTQPATPIKHISPQQAIDKKSTGPSAGSISSVGDNEFVKMAPITQSFQSEPAKSMLQVAKDLTPSGRDKPQTTEVFPAPLVRAAKTIIGGDAKSTLVSTPINQNVLRGVGPAITPPDPFGPQYRKAKVESQSSITPFMPATKPLVLPMKDAIRSAGSAPRNKPEPKQFPIGTPSTSSDSVELSDAFRLVIEQVSREFEKLSENVQNLAKDMGYQYQSGECKTEADLGNAKAWTLADIRTISGIIETRTKTITELVAKIPALDKGIQEVETSLKKMEAKRKELDRLVQIVRDPGVRELIHSRKLAPDFAYQQKEIRHTLHAAEETLRDLASALTILKAGLADDKGSFGVHSPSTSGIYRVVNNIFSRLQSLSIKVTALEKRVHNVREFRFGSPSAENTLSRSNIPSQTPVSTGNGTSSTPIGKTRTLGMSSSPSGRGVHSRKTMLDDKLDLWEADDIIREEVMRKEHRKKIAALLRNTQPISTDASMR